MPLRPHCDICDAVADDDTSDGEVFLMFNGDQLRLKIRILAGSEKVSDVQKRYFCDNCRASIISKLYPNVYAMELKDDPDSH